MYKLEKYKHKLMLVNGGGGWLVSKVTDPYLDDHAQKRVYKREYLRLKSGGGKTLVEFIETTGLIKNKLDAFKAEYLAIDGIKELIQKDKKLNGKNEKIGRFVAAIETAIDKGVDIFTFQELDGPETTHTKNAKNAKDSIDSILSNYDCCYLHHGKKKKFGRGVGIYYLKSKFKMLNKKTTHMTTKNKKGEEIEEDPLIAVLLEDNVSKEKIIVVTTHLASGKSKGEERDEQRRTITTFIQKIKSIWDCNNVVLAMDGNCENISYPEVTNGENKTMDSFLSELGLLNYQFDNVVQHGGGLDPSLQGPIFKEVLKIRRKNRKPNQKNLLQEQLNLDDDSALVTVLKMRGPATVQIHKIGDPAVENIDYLAVSDDIHLEKIINAEMLKKFVFTKSEINEFREYIKNKVRNDENKDLAQEQEDKFMHKFMHKFMPNEDHHSDHVPLHFQYRIGNCEFTVYNHNILGANMCDDGFLNGQAFTANTWGVIKTLNDLCIKYTTGEHSIQIDKKFKKKDVEKQLKEYLRDYVHKEIIDS